jgi:NADPH2:quinone reductase
MPQAIRIHEYGGPEAMHLEDVAAGRLGPRQLRIRQTAIGVNFIDTYHRTGLYPVQLPSGLGGEAAGTVIEVGGKLQGFSPDDRVAYVHSTPGAYAEERVIDASSVIKLPDGISDRQAAAILLKGLTAWFLLRRCYRVRRNEPVLLHAAAGGVGLIALQWATTLGARVIAVVGSDEKAALVREHGATEVIVCTREDLVVRVREITRKRGVAVVYDGVGKDTFFASLDCLGPRGLMVSYGNASGAPPPFSPLELTKRGSLYLTRPTLFHYIAKASDRARGARELFEIIGSGKVKVRIGQTYSLSNAAQAHRDLEARRTTGSTILLAGAGS